jgi:DNA (cytosine-5)-methyltransferase 1
MTLRAIGIISGIGSMLIGARQAGFDVVANIDWREYYFAEDAMGRNTFRMNFPTAVFKRTKEQMTDEEFTRFSNPDLALCHCDCGNFSILSSANKSRDRKLYDAGDLPFLTDYIAKFRPRYFVADNLPKSFLAFPIEEYHRLLPDYDIFPEYVSNWGYGNVQKGRKRMFVIGALKSEGFVFRANESPHSETVQSTLEDLPSPSVGSNYPNHDLHDDDAECYRALNLGGYRNKNTWSEAIEYFKDKPTGFCLEYMNKEGKLTKRIGFSKNHWDKHSHVLTGGNPTIHPVRGNPHTIRERARIQGFPDDFVFYGTVFKPDGRWSHDDNLHMTRQTGKAMPIQFCKYVSDQIRSHIEGKEWSCSNTRLLPADPNIDSAKYWFCKNVGYANQRGACDACWMQKHCDLCLIPQEKKAARIKTPTSPKIKAPTEIKQITTKRMTFGGA